MFIRHAENITLNNVEFYFKNTEKRPVLYLEDVKKGTIIDLQASIDAKSPLINIKNSSDLFIRNPVPQKKCESGLDISGKKSASIRIDNVDKSRFKNLFKISEEVNKNTVKIGTVY